MAATVTADNYPSAGILTRAMMSYFDSVKPQRSPELFRRFGQQYMPDFEFIRSLGREEPVADTFWKCACENRYHRTITVAGTISDPGADTHEHYVLAAGDVGSAGTGYATYPRLEDIVYFPGSGNNGQIKAITGAGTGTVTLEIHPVKAGATLGLVTAGDELPIISSGFVEGSAQPLGVRQGETIFTFYTQILKETISATGTALTEEPWEKVLSDGKDVGLWYSPGYSLADYRLALKIDGMIWAGQLRTSTNSAFILGSGSGAGNTTQLSRGIIDWVKSEGHHHDISMTSFDPMYLDEDSLYLQSQGATSGFAIWFQGLNLNILVENALKGYLDYTAVDFTRATDGLFGGNQGLAVAVNFKAFTKGGVCFIQKPMPGWSNPTTFGVAGSVYPYQGLIGPISSMRNGAGEKIDNFAIRYKAYKGDNRRFRVWKVGAAGPDLSTYVNDIDQLNYYLRADLGVQFIGANQWVYQDPTA